MDPETGCQDAPGRIRDWVGGLVAIRCAWYGLRLGLLEALHGLKRGLPAEELARRLELDPAWVLAWATAAQASGLLQSDPKSHRFHLDPGLGETLLNPAAPGYAGGLVLAQDLEGRLGGRLAACFAGGGGPPAAEYGSDLPEALSALNRPLYEHLLGERILPALPDLPPALGEEGKALEIGCGTGQGLLALARAFPSATVTGLDADEACVEAALAAAAEAGLAERVTAASMAAEALSAADQYDLVYAQDVLHEAADPALVVANIYRALRPGGLLLVTQVYAARAPAAADPSAAFLAYIDAFVRFPTALAEGRPAASHLTPAELAQLAQAAGFAAVQDLPLEVPLVHVSFAKKQP